MKRFYNVMLVLTIPALFFILTSETNSAGGSPGGKTGSPGDGFNNCTECHTGTATPEEMWIYSPELLISGYNTGQTYDMFVIGLNPTPQKFGFEATAEDATGTKVGTFAPGIDGFTKMTNNNKAVTHTPAGTIPLTNEGTAWMFKWTAPPTSTGNITFYAAINVANGNGTNSGDQIKLSTFSISPAVGITDNYHMGSFKVYPNPTSGTINIASDEDLNKIDVLNLHGQIVYSENSDKNAVAIELSHLQKGIYFIRSSDRIERIIIR